MKFLPILHWTLLALLLLASGLLAAAWVEYSRASPPNLTLGNTTCHLALRSGSLCLTTFSTTAEDNRYHTVSLPTWATELSLLTCTALLGWRIARSRRRPTSTRGFPLHDETPGSVPHPALPPCPPQNPAIR